MHEFRTGTSLYFAHAQRSPMAAALSTASRVGASGENARIFGESGTGKETIARLIHSAGPDRLLRFVVVRCAGRARDELAIELFGASCSPDSATSAGTGTILLEDVIEMPAALQARLVEWMDAMVAGEAPRVRIVAASTNDILQDVTSGRFRRDLFDALACPIHVPPLRERREDVPQVWDRCWSTVSDGRMLSSGARELIKQYAWPGNARELRAFAARLAASCTWQNIATRDVELQLFATATGIPAHALSVCVSEASAEAEPLSLGIPVAELRRVGLDVPATPADQGTVDLPEILRRVEVSLIDWALGQTQGNKAAAAQRLGIGRTTLVQKIRRLYGARPLDVPVEAWPSSCA